MGGGTYSSSSFASYSISSGKSYDRSTGRVHGQSFHSSHLKEVLNPKGHIRECCNSAEHPNTIPVILALDVTGSMGSACKETAEALGVIMQELYKKYKDIEICVMGVGDFECDDAPLQVSQFESDVRVAQQLDQIWMEHGGGGNGYESYTAPWLFGLYRTKLDAYDQQGRKGIIITMGDEPLNPDLPSHTVVDYLGKVDGGEEFVFDTPKLYELASKKFDIYHLAVDAPDSSYSSHEHRIKETFPPILGDHFKVTTIDSLASNIVACIDDSLSRSGASSTAASAPKAPTAADGEITW